MNGPLANRVHRAALRLYRDDRTDTTPPALRRPDANGSSGDTMSPEDAPRLRIFEPDASPDLPPQPF